MPKTLKIGIIQQANTADLHENLMNLAHNIEEPDEPGAQY